MGEVRNGSTSPKPPTPKPLTFTDHHKRFSPLGLRFDKPQRLHQQSALENLRFQETLSKGHTDASMSRSKRYLVSDTSSDNELVMWSAYCDSLVYRLAPRTGRRGCTSILRFSPEVPFWANRKRPKSDAKMLRRFYGFPPVGCLLHHF